MTEATGMSLTNVHLRSQCEGEYCTIHNQSHHNLTGLPQFFDVILMAMFRVCLHRQFHIDPDELERNKIAFPCKDCCGCCRAKESP